MSSSANSSSDDEHSARDEPQGEGGVAEEMQGVGNRGEDDGRGDGGDGGDGGYEDSPKKLSEIHAMLKALLSTLNIKLPTTGIAENERSKRVRSIKSTMMTLVATPAARGIETVIKYLVNEMPIIIQMILR